MFSGSQNSYKNSHRQLANCINKTPQHDVRTLKIIIITAIVVSLFVSVYFFRYAIMFSVLDLVYFDVSLVLLFIYVSVWHAFCLSMCVLRWECFFVFLLFDVFVVAINMDSFRRHHHYYYYVFVVRSLNIIFLPFPIVIRRRNSTLPSQLICIFCGMCMKSDSVLTPPKYYKYSK